MGIKGLLLLMIKEEGLQVSVLGSERCSISQNVESVKEQRRERQRLESNESGIGHKIPRTDKQRRELIIDFDKD